MFPQQPIEVRPHRPMRETEARGDLFVGQAGGDEREHLSLARGDAQLAERGFQAAVAGGCAGGERGKDVLVRSGKRVRPEGGQIRQADDAIVGRERHVQGGPERRGRRGDARVAGAGSAAGDHPEESEGMLADALQRLVRAIRPGKDVGDGVRVGPTAPRVTAP